MNSVPPFYSTGSGHLNICQIDDPFARYQMPDLELRTKHQLTFWLNIQEVAKALKVPHQLISKYLSQSISTMTKYYDDSEELQINGLHSKDDLHQHLRAFLTEYVICPKCQLPELDYLPAKKRLARGCRSCGKKEEVDVKTNRLNRWFLTHLMTDTQDDKKKKKKNKSEPGF